MDRLAAEAEMMPRVDAIWRAPLFQHELARIAVFERGRRFCHHDLAHLLDVARLSWIRILEEGVSIPCDLVYAVALLHDIGRAEQYETGEPHDVAGERIATEILAALPGQACFNEDEQRRIRSAVRAHRSHAVQDPLARVIAWADKASRPCFACPAASDCNWSLEKRNLNVRI
ncbi:HD domain-containing protein [Collinsella vaginalis]|uniref:HD domain-containing protein n=1 Tax=Collinsella vaginalis TaxID=1870987 RepID=UPI000BE7BE6E|nr:HD domain-containing protein [Collinsella vaginalis]